MLFQILVENVNKTLAKTIFCHNKQLKLPQNLAQNNEIFANLVDILKVK